MCGEGALRLVHAKPTEGIGSRTLRKRPASASRPGPLRLRPRRSVRLNRQEGHEQAIQAGKTLAWASVRECPPNLLRCRSRRILYGMSDDLGTRFARAVAARDEAALAACFVPDIEFRALTPPGLRERKGAGETAALFSRWFRDSIDLHLLHSRGDEVGDRLYLSYRLGGVEEGEPFVVEHHLFCTLANDRIERADLLCSGFRPPAATST